MKRLSGCLHGDVLRSVSLAGLTLTETVYAPRLELPVHSHERAYFCFVLGGSFTEVYGKRTRSCHLSTLIFHPADETHSDHFHTGTRCFNVQMNARWLERVCEHPGTLKSAADFRGGRLAHLAMRLYQESCEIDEISSLMVEGLVLEIVAEASRCFIKESSRTPPHWLKQARQFLDEQCTKNLTLTVVAELVGVHSTHLAREFRRYYHRSVGEYVRARRIEFACHKIATSDLPLSEISLAAGFFDQSHFARTFKLTTGMTPAVYRAITRRR
ncbi:MAG: AraC family transcriptional regulator [Pyrinomonadaceae bacterium]|nr:AraC family transcriptional regulator [Pyrinomonadaceae bacterium]